MCWRFSCDVDTSLRSPGTLVAFDARCGAAVAIAGAFMIGLGFKPFQAAVLDLIANTAPVAWGAIGTPVHALASVTSLPESDLSAMIGRILPITAIIVPFWLVRAMVSWKETFEVFPAILVVGGSFAATQWFWSNYVDSNLVDIVAGVVSMTATLLFLRFWQPKRIWRFADEPAVNAAEARASIKHYSAGQIAKAWMPFAILSVFVLVWGLPAVKLAMNKVTTPSFKVAMAEGKTRPGPPGWDWPYLHAKVFRAAPVVQKAA